MTETVDVAIVGAGPYGLSLAAHLRAAGVRFRQFGRPMGLWQDRMPAGMFLKSQPFASNLSDPRRSHTLAAYYAEIGRPYVSYGVPVPLDVFTGYGQWFQRELVPDLEQVLVRDIAGDTGDFAVTLDTGEVVRAGAVVVATGVEHFAHRPTDLTGLPPELCSHSSAHTDLGVFRDRDLTVLGAGQSALESAALAAEQGARVRMVVRAGRVAWNGVPLAPERSLYRRLREPEAALGSGLSTWFYSDRPGLFRHLPAGLRVRKARTALGPAGAHWLRERIEGRVPILLGHRLEQVEAAGDRLRLRLRAPDGTSTQIGTDHVLAATGYRAELRRLTFVSGPLAARVRLLAGTPDVGRYFESSVPGLFFTGPAVAPTFGPLMRFVHGCDFASRRLARRLIGTATSGRSVPVSAAVPAGEASR